MYITTEVKNHSTSGNEDIREVINLNEPCEPTLPCGKEEE